MNNIKWGLGIGPNPQSQSPNPNPQSPILSIFVLELCIKKIF